jgi:RHS repeat-associated protein
MPTPTPKYRPYYYPFGSSLNTRSFSTGSGFRFGFNTQEKDKEIYNNYETYTATFWEYDGRLGRRWNVDPEADERESLTPYNSMSNNPINRIDPNGQLDDWVQNDETGEYKWMDNVTSVKNTPKGYSYVGRENNDILKDLKLNYSFPEQNINRIGFLAADAEIGKFAVSHMINVKEKSNIRITADVSYNLNGGTENNALGRKFEGVNVLGTLVSANSGADGTVSTYASLNLTYGDISFQASFREPQGDYFKQTGTEIGVASILIPPKNLSQSKGFTMLNVSGSWWVHNAAGFDIPVIYHPLFFPNPQSFKQSWTFTKR